MPGSVPKLPDTPGGVAWTGPRLGEHTDAVLAELGYSPADIAKMHQDGAL